MITQYLQGPYQQDGMEYKSPYMAALMDARAATGRNVNTGQIVDASKAGNWSGALAYLVLIDHIGIFLSKVENGDTNPVEFIKALKDFTNLSDPHIYAIYALRCAFAHQYSLINVGKGHNAPLKHHQFEVHPGENLIALPPDPWDGIPTLETNNIITSISLKKLGDLVEEINIKLVAMAAANQLKADGELIFIHHSIQV
jgi:hypothetical protein